MFQVTINRTLCIWGKATKPEHRRKGFKALLCSPAEMDALTPVGPGPAPLSSTPILAVSRVEALRASGIYCSQTIRPRGEWLNLGSFPGQPGRREDPTQFLWLSEVPPDPQPAQFTQHQLHSCSFLQNSKILPPCGGKAIPTPVCTGPTGDQPNLFSKPCQPRVLPWVLLAPSATSQLSNVPAWLWEGDRVNSVTARMKHDTQSLSRRD